MLGFELGPGHRRRDPTIYLDPSSKFQSSLGDAPGELEGPREDRVLLRPDLAANLEHRDPADLVAHDDLMTVPVGSKKASFLVALPSSGLLVLKPNLPAGNGIA